MARDGHSEIDVTSPGITSGAPSKGGWVQNAFWRNNAWEIRKGFGQMGEWDTSLSATRDTASVDDEDLGLEKQLGAYTIDKTSFGHTQIVSVWKAKVITSKMVMRGRRQPVFVVFIYDVTTGKMWEEVLYRHTSQTASESSLVTSSDGTTTLFVGAGKRTYDMSSWHANYETSFDEDYQSWSSGADTGWWFVWFRDSLYMGAKGVPPMVYSPIDPWKRKGQQCNRLLSNDLAPVYGESSSLAWAGPVEGITPESLPYLSSSQLPWFSSAAAIGNFVAAAKDYNVYFSVNGQPFIFGGDSITMTEKVRALFPQGNSLLIFTDSKTYMLQPGSPMLSSGRLITLSDSIGCAGNLAVTQIGRSGQSVAWADKSGVHITTGSLQVQTISDDVDPFFSSFLEDPLTSYFVASGLTDVSKEQPRSVSSYDPDGCNLTYSPSLDLLLATFPNAGVSLCYSENKWSLWTTTSRATGIFAYAVENIKRPFYCASSDDLFLVGGVDSELIDDGSGYYDVANARQLVGATRSVFSAYFLRYGRGGAIDRSTRREDYRIGSVRIKDPHGSSSGAIRNGILLFDEPIVLPVGYKFSMPGVAGHTVIEDQETILVPVKIATQSLGATVHGVDEIHITMQFDNTLWQPLFSAPFVIWPMFPSERLGSAAGWFTGPTANISEMRCYDNIGGALSSSGNTLQLHFSGAAVAANLWTHHPKMNLPVNQMATLMFLPFVKKIPSDANSSSLGISNVTCTYDEASAVVSKTANVLVTSKTSMAPATRHYSSSKAQAVDWTIKSEPAALQEGILMQGRGLFILIENRGLGDSTTSVAPSTAAGLMSLISAADGKEWVGQIIDTSELNPTPALLNTANKQTVLERVFSSGSVVRPLYGSADVTYGNSLAPATGTYICGSAEIDIVQISEAQKGESISWMLYGYVTSRGQGLRVQSVKAEVTKAGERRRYNR